MSDNKGFDRRFECYVDSMSYDFETKGGRLYIEDGGYCDMMGTIDVFMQIDPTVEFIGTYSGVKPDVCYVRLPGLPDWDAFLPREVGSIGVELEVPFYRWDWEP